MKPDRIFILRHGQSIGNADKSVYREIPDYALTLTDLGKRQAVEAGERIGNLLIKGNPITRPSIQFYVSPFWRTRQTYLGVRHGMNKIMGDRLKTTFYEDPRLREQEWGSRLQARTDEQASKVEEYRDNYGHFYYRFRDGESCADVFDRVSDFMGTLFRDFEKVNYARNVVVVTHGMTMRLFLMRWFHANVEEFESWGNPWNCEMLILQRTEFEKYELLTPMKIHNIHHTYQFNWGEDSEYGNRKVPTRTQQEPIYPE